MDTRNRIFYGWAITAIAVITMAQIYGIRHSFSVLFPYILQEFHWERGSTALMFSINILFYGFLAPVAGSLCIRWKSKNVILIGISVLTLSAAGIALASELWHFYVLFGLMMPVGTALSGMPLLMPTLANWFITRRGLVFGLGQVGGGLSFVYGIFVNYVISHLGWRTAYLVLAATLVAILLPLYVFFFYSSPGEKGLSAYGTSDEESPETPQTAVPLSDFDGRTFTQTLMAYQLWLLVLSMFLFWGVGTYLVMAHQVRFAIDQGYSSMFAASVFALFGLFMAAGQISGFISDRIGRESTIALGTLLAIVALIAIISVKGTSKPWLLYVHSMCLGYGSGLFTVAIYAGTADLFSGKYFGAVAGFVLTGMGVGGAIGPWLGGKIFDLTGSYTNAFILCIICYGLSLVAFVIAAPRKAAEFRTQKADPAEN
jgi:MFS family permease